MEETMQIYVGKGNPSMQEDYVDFINYVFGFNGTAKNFYKLLPKLYKPEYDPASNSYVVTENGKLKAAVGAFSHEIEVCGITLKCRGIGNVAVHPFSRSKGYMKKTLGMAMDDMVADGIDLSILGGLRARYNYFSFEREGTMLAFKLGSAAVRHHFGAERTSRFTYRFLRPDDTEALDEIEKLLSMQAYRPIRPREMLYDILASWEEATLLVYEGDRFAGYFVCGDGEILETQLYRTEDFSDMLIGAYDFAKRRDLTVMLPAFRQDLAAQLYTVAESYDVKCSKMFSVLCYENVIRAFMKLKATYEMLPDGELVLLIHGRGGEERLLLSVKDGVPSVETTENRAPDLTLEHIEAMNLLFAPYAPARLTLPSFAKVWFPLPLYVYSSDAV